MGRNVSSGSLVRSQADLFFPAGSTNRVDGVDVSSLTLKVFANNAPLAWALVDGTSVQDSAISSGSVYFSEISGSPGYYSVRFFPDRVGFWRLVLRSASLGAEVALEFDVTTPVPQAGGLNASFTK